MEKTRGQFKQSNPNHPDLTLPYLSWPDQRDGCYAVSGKLENEFKKKTHEVRDPCSGLKSRSDRHFAKSSFAIAQANWALRLLGLIIQYQLRMEVFQVIQYEARLVYLDFANIV